MGFSKVGRAPYLKFANTRGWREMKPHVVSEYKINRQTLRVMDEAVPILERELFRECTQQIDFTDEGKQHMILTTDEHHFFPGTEVIIRSISLTFHGNAEIWSLLRFNFSNPTPGIVEAERIEISLREDQYSLGKLPILVSLLRSADCRGGGLFGYYIHHEGAMRSSRGLPVGLDANAAGKDMWQQMWEAHPPTGIHASLFFKYESAGQIYPPLPPR